tara:strand:- start:10901 stop:11887 length:987 start_codon:yes stop_codon:yes gene_type:complete
MSVFNPYQDSQPQIQQYGGMKEILNKIKEGIQLDKRFKGKHIKAINEDIEKILNDINKKKKKKGLIGGLLGLGSMFIPGLGKLGKSLISGLIAGATSKDTLNMLEDKKAKIQDLMSGTFMDKTLRDVESGLESEIESYDPVRAAIESAALTAIMSSSGGKGEKAAEAPTEISQELKESYGGGGGGVGFSPDLDATESIINTGQDSLSSFDLSTQRSVQSPDFISNLSKSEIPINNISTPSTNVSVASKTPFFQKIGFTDPNAPTAADTWQKAMSPFKQDNWKQGMSKAGANWTPFLSSYVSGAMPSFGMNPISDNLAMLMQLMKKGNK